MNEETIAFIFHELESRRGVLHVAGLKVAREGDINPATDLPFSLNDLSELATRINEKIEEVIEAKIDECLQDFED